MRRHLLLIFSSLILLVILAGCGVFTHITVDTFPDKGHPTSEDGGLLVKFVVTGGNGTIAVDFGDGTNGRYETETFAHLYVMQGKYPYVIMRGGARTAGKITVLNDNPYARRPFSGICGTVEWREMVTFNPSYSTTGCSVDGPITCKSLKEWGINDPNGDPLMIRITAFRENGKPESLFIPNHPDNSTLCRDDDSPGIFTPEDAKRVNDEWISIQPIIWFVGWTWDSPPIPLGIGSAAAFYIVNFTMEVRDPWGGYGRIEWSEKAQTGCGY